MIRNTSDGDSGAPSLRCYLNLMSLEGAPVDFEAIAEAGYEGVQFAAPATAKQQSACARWGLGKASLGRVNAPADADLLAARFRDEGVECGTLHIGWGMEDDAEADRLIDAVLAASERYGIPLYVETHRATIFQDLWRTVQFVVKFPELRFNGDFSHWYTGLEMVYGGFENKLRYIQPVIERVRFVHGRIGNPGCIQVDIGEGDTETQPFVEHFRTMWTQSFAAFLRNAAAGDYILFVPELLSPRIYYGHESDRWAQSLVLRRIARECFTLARELR
ncbi:MAG: hypothetical protein JWP63_1232 [Candidatus Solibacter sp.]|nr:hypothetical protein [Candidatus Solibacter sp.]